MNGYRFGLHLNSVATLILPRYSCYAKRNLVATSKNTYLLFRILRSKKKKTNLIEKLSDIIAFFLINDFMIYHYKTLSISNDIDTCICLYV